MNNNIQASYAPPPSKWEGLKAEIKAAAPEIGIDDIGFATAEPFLYLKNILQEHRDNGYDSGFEEPDLDKRTIPALQSGGQPQSIIAIAVAYPSKMENPPKSEPGARRGILARASWGRDYHHVLREALVKLEAFIRERVPGAELESMVDTGVLVDRAVAERAGIGFSAKNCSIISPKWGSWIYLGEMVTNIPFPPDTPVEEGCGSCTKCIDACPTGALVGPGQLNAQACISYLTQTKGFLSDEYMTKIGNRLYGCDTCQIVCPKNRGKNWNHRPELLPDPEIVKPLLLPILELSNREFKEQFGSSSAAWRGKKPIQRNAVIALGNFKEAGAVPKLTEIVLKEARPELRGSAAWALGRIGGAEALAAVKLALQKEEDATVREMLERAQDKLLERQEAEEHGGVSGQGGGSGDGRIL
ncbi:Epoxyqueuosine reductase [compost metagenome]